jgi:hypothetical protein
MEIARSQGIVVLAVEKRNRVCRVRLQMPIPNLRKTIIAINEDYPILRWYDICICWSIGIARSQHLSVDSRGLGIPYYRDVD